MFYKFTYAIESHIIKMNINRNIMDKFSKQELEEAYEAIASTISKCEKVLPKLKQGSAQHTLLIRRIKALNISSSLIKQALEDL